MSEPRREPRPGAVGMLVFLRAFLLLSVTAAAAPAVDPRAVMYGVYAQDTSRDTSAKAAFEVFDGAGHSAVKRFIFLRYSSGSGVRSTRVEFTAPEEIRGVVLLSLQTEKLPARQYLYTPATGRVRAVVAQQRTSRFLGTDFSFEDIEGHQPGDFSYQLMAQDEMFDGHKTYRIRAVPVDPAGSQYKFIDYTVAQDAPVILQAEMHDAGGAMVRIEHATQLRQVSGIWGARRTEMRSGAEGTHTVLSIDEVHFNRGLAPRLFDPAALEAPEPAATGP